MKLKPYLQILLIAGITSFTFKSYSQQATGRKQLLGYYRALLQVDSAKAAAVLQVQESYKSAMNLVVADTALHTEAKRVKIKALIDDKNRKLRLLLTPGQQQKIIPNNER